jgi:hypothetical protein
VPNPKLATLTDAFTASSINTGLWSAITGGAATLDAVNDLVVLASPATNGAVNTFGSNSVFDATSSQIAAQIGVVPVGNGGTRTTFKLTLDASNSVAMRVDSGVFKLTLQTAGTTVTTTLPTYDPHAHRWWRLREAGGTFFADASPDGLNWTVLTSTAYSWSATGATFAFQTGALVTEVAGNSGTIQHVNTAAGGVANPNWPDVRDEWAPYWNVNGGDVPLDRYVDVSRRTQGTLGITRGRQYELDEVRAGEYNATLANPDAALDPANASGPWAGHILPFQPWRKRAQWPPTRNLLTQVQATGGDLGGQPLGAINTGNGGPSIFSGTDGAGGSFVSTAAAWQGATAMQFQVPNGIASHIAVAFTPQAGVEPGVTYTMQMRIRNITPSTSPQVEAYLSFATTGNVGTVTGGTPATLTGSTTAGWTTVSVTATATATAAIMYVGLRTSATIAAAFSVQVDGWQLERAGAPSAWTCPGVWYPMFGGFVERWPSQWQMGGTYGVIQPTVTDALALLSQTTLDDPLTHEINSNAPLYLYKLDDPEGSQSFADATGNHPVASLGTSKYGPGSFTVGASITATDLTNGVYTGGSGTVAAVANPTPGKDGAYPATFLNLASAGITGPVNPARWSRMIAFRWTGGSITNSAGLWASTDRNHSGGFPTGSRLYLYIDPSNHLKVDIFGPGIGATYAFPTTNVADGNWHLAIFGYDASAQEVDAWVDGAGIFYNPVTAPIAPTGLVSDSIGAYYDSIAKFCADNFAGNISYISEVSGLLSSTAVAQLYSAWRSSCAGESTDARYARILRYGGYIGPSSIQTGLTTSMGPAAFDSQDALTALQAVVDTEGGAHYADRAGTMTFKSRSARYNAFTPAYTFGERADLGEWPYEDCELDYDSTHLGNVVTVTQDSTSQTFTAQDQTSISAYFPRTLTRTVNSSDPFECQDAANYLLSRYKQPATRVSTLTLHPSANPGMWPVCLSLELGTRVRVMRRPPGVTPIQVECFIENIQWSLDDTGEATVTLQCSPADLNPYAVFAAWHTTLKTAVTAGAITITVNASADTTNPLATQLGPGQQLVLGLNTANAETVTVFAVGATSPGWTSAVITLAGGVGTTYSHAAGEILCEPLPAGVTDPTTYDASSAFDSTVFAY